jgi:hypothetical protein
MPMGRSTTTLGGERLNDKRLWNQAPEMTAV